MPKIVRCKHADLGVIWRRRGTCRQCEKERDTASKEKRIERHRKAAREWYQRNREKRRQANKDYRDKNPHKRQAQARRRKGMTDPEIVPELFAFQNGACAVCGTTDFGRQGPCADHDHKTGLVRGVLCDRHNVGIGKFKDDIQLLRNAIAYLLNPPGDIIRKK